jgi:hypothetical protein
MILKFQQYLEKRGFPDCIEPYAQMSYNECEKRLDKYLSRKGKFANYTDDIFFTWSDIEPFVSEENFEKFPVREFKIKFSIKSTPTMRYDNNISGDGTAYSILGAINNAINIKSVNARIDISLFIGYKDSFSIERIKDELKMTINHELFHIFEYCKELNNIYKKPFCLEQEMYGDIELYVFPMNDGTKIKIKDIPFLKRLIYSLYALSNAEMGAMVAQYKDVNVNKEYIEYYRTDFDIHIMLREIKKWFLNEFNLDLYNEFYNEFGEAFYGYYESIASKYLYSKNNLYEPLRNKNLEKGLEYLIKILNDRYEYFKKKVYKVNT